MSSRDLPAHPVLAPTESGQGRKLFLLVRRDLPWSVRAVQAAHAAVALSLLKRGQLQVGGPCGRPIVLLGVEGESQANEWQCRLGAEAVPFREPDLGDALTAVAYFGPPVAALATLRLL